MSDDLSAKFDAIVCAVINGADSSREDGEGVCRQKLYVKFCVEALGPSQQSCDLWIVQDFDRTGRLHTTSVCADISLGGDFRNIYNLAYQETGKDVRILGCYDSDDWQVSVKREALDAASNYLDAVLAV